MSVQARTRRRAARRQLAQVGFHLPQAAEAVLDLAGVAAELLAQPARQV